MKKVFFFYFSLILLIGSVSAQFGYDNPNLPKIDYVAPSGVTFNNNTGSVNLSDYWDNLNTFNSTQMQNSGGILNILESWLTSLINSIVSFNNIAWTNQTNVFTESQNFSKNIVMTENFTNPTGNMGICFNGTSGITITANITDAYAMGYCV